jgi:hypothetical protein
VLRRIARLGQRVLDEGAVRLLGLRDAQSPCRTSSSRAAQHRLQLRSLPALLGGPQHRFTPTRALLLHHQVGDAFSA